MQRFRRIVLRTVVGCAGWLAGCAVAQSPQQLAVAYRQTFNGAIQAVHSLHQQGGLSAAQERRLLPAILAGSAALDQMDADAAAGDQAGFDVAAAAARAAIGQIQAVSVPTGIPTSMPAGVDRQGAVNRPAGPSGG